MLRVEGYHDGLQVEGQEDFGNSWEDFLRVV